MRASSSQPRLGPDPADPLAVAVEGNDPPSRRRTGWRSRWQEEPKEAETRPQSARRCVEAHGLPVPSRDRDLHSGDPWSDSSKDQGLPSETSYERPHGVRATLFGVAEPASRQAHSGIGSVVRETDAVRAPPSLQIPIRPPRDPNHWTHPPRRPRWWRDSRHPDHREQENGGCDNRTLHELHTLTSPNEVRRDPTRAVAQGSFRSTGPRRTTSPGDRRNVSGVASRRRRRPSRCVGSSTPLSVRARDLLLLVAVGSSTLSTA
jgi:hypothetical protein